MTVWKCASCGTELPLERRIDMRYCGGRCRVQAHRIRKGEGQHVRPTKKHGHTALKVALGTVAAATAAAAAIELVREGQDARLEEQARKIADLEAQLQKAQAEKEEARRAQEGLRKQVEQLTREKKEKEAQLLQRGKELDAEKETVKALRSSLEITRQACEESELMRVMEEIGSRESLTKQIRLTDEYQRQLFDTSQQRDDLSLRNEKLSRQLAEAKDKREVQLAKISASKSHQQVKARLESARLTIWSLTQQLRAAETSRSSSPKVLPAKAPMKQLPAVQKTLPASSSQTALAVANQRIKELNSENQRLKQEMMKAEASAGRWEWNYRQLAAHPPAVHVVADESRQIARHSEIQEDTESDTPRFFKGTLAAIGGLGVGVFIGVGAVSMLGSASNTKVLGAAPEQKALGPRKQHLLPPKSDT